MNLNKAVAFLPITEILREIVLIGRNVECVLFISRLFTALETTKVCLRPHQDRLGLFFKMLALRGNSDARRMHELDRHCGFKGFEGCGSERITQRLPGSATSARSQKTTLRLGSPSYHHLQIALSKHFDYTIVC